MPPLQPTQLVATLITNPHHRILHDDFIHAAKVALGSATHQWLAEATACDIALPQAMAQEQAENILRSAIGDLPIDVAVQRQGDRRKGALIADMDSTMIEQECIDELAAEVGLKDHVAAITARAMNGEIEFAPALRERVSLLAGLPGDIAETVIRQRITLAGGGMQLVATMRANGSYCALVSGGFTLFTSRIAETLGFDEHRANILEVADGKLTGRVREPVLGAEAKVSALLDIAENTKKSAADFIAVGDGANDLPMLKRAGSGVALHAKPSVAATAPIRIDHGDLTSLLYLQGYQMSEFANV
jgi:phosphoserine phosphatase